MKNFKILAASIILLSLAQCKSKQKAVEANPGPAGSLPAASGKTPGELQMEIAETRWPGTAAQELKDGQSIYSIRCTKCHKAYVIEKFSEKKWLHEIDDMSPKAKLTAEEKLKLTKYVLSYRETKEKMKAQ